MGPYKNVSINEIAETDPFELNIWLHTTFKNDMPVSIESVADMQILAQMLGILTNQYSYLMAVLSFLKIMAKDEKAKDKNSAEAEKMMMRRDCFQTMADIVKQQYSAASRILTVKQEINKEMAMY